MRPLPDFQDPAYAYARVRFPPVPGTEPPKVADYRKPIAAMTVAGDAYKRDRQDRNAA